MPKVKNTQEPLWKGPQSEKGGISFSSLSDWLSCRERFRIKHILGLRPIQTFEKAIEYGQMWHTCEEAHAEGKPIEEPLKAYCSKLANQYPTQVSEIEKWYNVCKVQFPVYVQYWEKHKDMKQREPVCQEKWFKLPYTLPSGRIVYLKGFIDSIDLVGNKRKVLWQQENKSKGDINEDDMQRRLRFDCQTMLYMVAMEIMQEQGELPENRLAGIRYNVVRRPLSGGKGSIRQKKPTKANPQGESSKDFYERLQKDYIAAEPEYFFMRWNVEISKGDIQNYKDQFLNPVLEQLCDWYDFVTDQQPLNRWPSPSNGLHWMTPFGLYNSLTERNYSDLDEYILTGSEAGLERVSR